MPCCAGAYCSFTFQASSPQAWCSHCQRYFHTETCGTAQLCQACQWSLDPDQQAVARNSETQNTFQQSSAESPSDPRGPALPNYPKEQPDVSVKQKRKRYTFDDKLAILEYMDETGCSAADAARKFCLADSTVRGFRRNRKKTEGSHRRQLGDRKASYPDDLDRVKDVLIEFQQSNSSKPVELRIPLNVMVLSTIATETARNLLDRNKRESFLSKREVDALSKFQGSKTWVLKLAKLHCWDLIRETSNSFLTNT